MDGYDPVNLQSPLGLTAGLVLFGDTDGSIAQHVNFSYNSGADVLTVGTIRLTSGTAAAPSASFQSGTSTGFYYNSGITGLGVSTGGSARHLWVGGDSRMPSNESFGWSSSTDPASAGIDVGWVREGSDTVAQRRSTNPQAHRFYNTFTDASNYERINLDWSGNAAFLRVSAAGTGVNRNLNLGTEGASNLIFRTNGASRWIVDGANSTFRLTANANYAFAHGTSALATTDTEGFFHLQSCAGHPTGTPASIPTAQKPMVWNSTDKALELYDSAWREITPLGVEATSDQTATSDATVNDDSALVVNVRASGVYEFEIFIFVNNAGAAGGFRCTIAGTVTATSIKAQAHFAGEGLGHATDMQRFAALGTEVSSVSGAPSGNSHVRIVGTIEVSAAGTFLFRWSQAVSSASTTTRQRNSYMKLTRVG